MDYYYQHKLLDTVFEWDENKDDLNFRKHGIHFKTAARVFMDPYRMIRLDQEHTEEDRYNVLGRVGKIIFVVCVFVDAKRIRIISARFATANEKEQYIYG